MADRAANARINATAAASGRQSPSPLRQRPLMRAATMADATSPLNPGQRRRGSFMTNESFDRQSLRSSTDDLLLPRVHRATAEAHPESSHLHSLPLALALLPAAGGLLFNGGGAVVTDIILLLLASIFLNWSVRLPWEWYHSAQSIQLQDDEDGFQDSYFPSTTTIIEEEPLPLHPDHPSSTPPEKPASPPPADSAPPRPTAAQTSANTELRIHELLALAACFLSPVMGAYLLHTIRGQLSQGRVEGLVSDYNLSIFLLAAEFRPCQHLIKLIMSRTLHLQRLVAQNPHLPNSASPSTVADLVTRVNELEAHIASKAASISDPKSSQNGNASGNGTVDKEKDLQALAASVRGSLQPELDAVTRATRRYEKRATLLGLQMESRLADLESRMRDALTLAAGAERAASQRSNGISSLVAKSVEGGIWVLTLPMRVVEKMAVGTWTLVVGSFERAGVAVGWDANSKMGGRGKEKISGGKLKERRRRD